MNLPSKRLQFVCIWWPLSFFNPQKWKIKTKCKNQKQNISNTWSSGCCFSSTCNFENSKYFLSEKNCGGEKNICEVRLCHNLNLFPKHSCTPLCTVRIFIGELKIGMMPSIYPQTRDRRYSFSDLTSHRGTGWLPASLWPGTAASEMELGQSLPEPAGRTR